MDNFINNIFINIIKNYSIISINDKSHLIIIIYYIIINGFLLFKKSF